MEARAGSGGLVGDEDEAPRAARVELDARRSRARDHGAGRAARSRRPTAAPAAHVPAGRAAPGRRVVPGRAARSRRRARRSSPLPLDGAGRVGAQVPAVGLGQGEPRGIPPVGVEESARRRPPGGGMSSLTRWSSVGPSGPRCSKPLPPSVIRTNDGTEPLDPRTTAVRSRTGLTVVVVTRWAPLGLGWVEVPARYRAASR